MHSHGAGAAFWSEQDDADDLAGGLYLAMVLGNRGREFLVRAATYGHLIALPGLPLSGGDWAQ